MEIIESIKGEKRKMLVEGAFLSENETGDLLAALDASKPFCSEITFVKTRMLPVAAVERIAQLQRSGTLVYTTERSLWYYLSILNIDNHYKSPYARSGRPQPVAVGIGGSAGCIERIIEILTHLHKADIAVFVTVHLKSDHIGSLSAIFQKYTPHYRLKEAVHNERVESGTVYIAPPDRHLIVSEGHIFLSDTGKVSYSRPSISVMFNALALEYQDELATVLLSGYGDDGSGALGYVKEAGGIVLVEDPQGCAAKDMPASAIRTGNYDAVLDVKGISAYINSMLGAPQSGEVPETLLKGLFDVYGYDFRNYNQNLLQRRVAVTKKRVGIEDDRTFYARLLEERSLFDEFFLDLSINVTTFFRNPETFRMLREKVLPYLGSFAEIKIWCAGCSTGEEPYSLAIVLDELGLLDKCQIYATDFNDIKLYEAKNGIFAADKLAFFKEGYQRSGGEGDFDDYFHQREGYAKISNRIKSKVLFFKHNLVNDGILNEFQLILCRNVLIYFDEMLRNRIVSLLDASLSRNGFLVLGESEPPPAIEDTYSAYGADEKIYKKIR